MHKFLIGFVLGVSNIGFTSWRQVKIQHGQIFATVSSSLIASVGYYYSISTVVNQDLVGYVGFSVGGAVITGIIAWWELRKIKKAIKDKANKKENKND